MTDRSARPSNSTPGAAPAAAAPRDAVQRWRLVFARDTLPGDPAQREQLAAWERALADSGLPVAGLDLAPPRPRFAVAAPLSGTVPGEAELADTWLVERLPGWRVREALEGRLPPGHRLVDLFDVWLGEPALPGQVVASVYRADMSRALVEESTLAAAAGAMLVAGTLPRRRRKGETTVAYDLRPFLDGITVEPGRDPGRLSMRMTLRHDPEKGIGRPDEVLGELADRLGAALVPDRLVRERLILAVDRAGPPGRRTGDGQATSASTRRGRK